MSSLNLEILQELQTNTADFSNNPLSSLTEEEVDFIRKRTWLKILREIKKQANYKKLPESTIRKMNEKLLPNEQISIQPSSISEEGVRKIVDKTLENLEKWWTELDLKNHENFAEKPKKEFVLTEKNKAETIAEVKNYKNWFEWMDKNYKSISYKDFVEVQKHETKIAELKKKKDLDETEKIKLHELEIQLEMFLQENSNEYSTLEKVIEIYESSKNFLLKKGRRAHLQLLINLMERYKKYKK